MSRRALQLTLTCFVPFGIESPQSSLGFKYYKYSSEIAISVRAGGPVRVERASGCACEKELGTSGNGSRSESIPRGGRID